MTGNLRELGMMAIGVIVAVIIISITIMALDQLGKQSPNGWSTEFLSKFEKSLETLAEWAADLKLAIQMIILAILLGITAYFAIHRGRV